MSFETETRSATPYGPFGLLLSLVCAGVLAALYLAFFAGVGALADSALFGWSRMLATIQALRAGVVTLSPSIVLAGYAAGILLYLAIAASILSLARFRGGAGWRALVAWPVDRAWWRDRGYWSFVAVAIAYGAGASALLSKFYPPSNNWFSLAPGPAALLVALVLVVFAAPFTEELVFRGWIYTSLRSRFGSVASVVISALLFAFAHYEHTHLYALAVLPVGLILGMVRERTGTIWATASLHALYNFSAWLFTALGAG